MKKVSLLLLIVVVASVLLMAAAPMRLIRLTVINKSEHTIYMKLEGSSVGEQFYYLTIAKGTKSLPEVATFTIVQDVYSRTTWYGPGDSYCEGWKSSGELIATRNLKLNFVPCGTVPSKRVLLPYDSNGDGIDDAIGLFKVVNYGEPSWGEKISYFKWVAGEGNGCSWVIWSTSFKSPRGCYFHYQY